MYNGVEKAATLRSDIGPGERGDKFHGLKRAVDLFAGRMGAPNSLKLLVNTVELGANPVTATKEISFFQERTPPQ